MWSLPPRKFLHIWIDGIFEISVESVVCFLVCWYQDSVPISCTYTVFYVLINHIAFTWEALSAVAVILIVIFFFRLILVDLLMSECVGMWLPETNRHVMGGWWPITVWAQSLTWSESNAHHSQKWWKSFWQYLWWAPTSGIFLNPARIRVGHVAWEYEPDSSSDGQG